MWLMGRVQLRQVHVSNPGTTLQGLMMLQLPLDKQLLLPGVLAGQAHASCTQIKVSSRSHPRFAWP